MYNPLRLARSPLRWQTVHTRSSHMAIEVHIDGKKYTQMTKSPYKGHEVHLGGKKPT